MDEFDENLEQQEQLGESYSFPGFGVNKVGEFAKGVKDGVSSLKKDDKKEEDPNLGKKDTNQANNQNPNSTPTQNPVNNQNNTGVKSPNKKEDNKNNVNPSSLNKKENTSLLNKKEDEGLLNKEKKESSLDKKENDIKKSDKDKKKKKSSSKKGKDSGTKNIFNIKLTLKTKIFLGMGLIIVFLLLFLLIFLIPLLYDSMHGISGSTGNDFVCEMGQPLEDGTYTVVSGYGWRIRTFGSNYWSKHAITKNPHCKGSCTEDCETDSSKTDENGNFSECTIYAYDGITKAENIYTGEFTDEANYYYEVGGSMKVANFNNGIDLSTTSDSYIYAVHPGLIKEEHDLGDKGIGLYTIIDHREAGDMNVDSIYGRMKSKTDEFTITDSVVMEDVMGNTSGKSLYFEVQENGIGMNLNGYFGYDDPSGECANRSSSPSIDYIEKNCNSLPNYIGENGMNRYCNSVYGNPIGEYSSFACGSQNYTVKKIVTGQCAAGVYQYFFSFLPNFDWRAWHKFGKIYGNAIDYWTKNNALGRDGFKANRTPTPGSLMVFSYSNSKDEYGKPYGHILVVEKVEGETLTIFECNYDANESCRSIDINRKKLEAMYHGSFLGYIHILGDC